LLHNHPHLSSGAGTISQKWPQYKGLSPTPLAIIKKKIIIVLQDCVYFGAIHLCFKAIRIFPPPWLSPPIRTCRVKETLHILRAAPPPRIWSQVYRWGEEDTYCRTVKSPCTVFDYFWHFMVPTRNLSVETLSHNCSVLLSGLKARFYR
jgi:hypothetical protein